MISIIKSVALLALGAQALDLNMKNRNSHIIAPKFATRSNVAGNMGTTSEMDPDPQATGTTAARTGTKRFTPATTTTTTTKRKCCKARKATCLACEAGQSIKEFCTSTRLRRVPGCKLHQKNQKQQQKPDSQPLVKIPCVSDEDCLQVAASNYTCPTFCIDGQCAAWEKDYPPVLRLRSNIKAKTGSFVLREGEELEKLFESAPTWYPKGLLENRFFERVEGSEELLEVRYPAGFFEMAAKALEETDGVVPSSFKSNDVKDTEKPRSTSHTATPAAGDSIDVPGAMIVGRLSNVGSRFSGVSANFQNRDRSRYSLDAGRKLNAIQDVAPDRWHAGPWNTQHPWRMTGRLSMGCTAALIGNRVLVTAAHCVWDKDTDSWDSFPDFAAGQDGDDKPYGDVHVSRMTIPACYQTCNSNNECRGCDWAVLVLRSSDKLNVGYFGFRTGKSGTLNIAGYPQSKERQQWYDNCPLHSDEGKWIKHRCDTERGNSGSGIYTINNGGRYIVAIHGGGYTDRWNRGADVAGKTSSAGRLFDRMLAEKRTYG